MKSYERRVTTTIRLPNWLDEKIAGQAEYFGMSKNAFLIMILNEKGMNGCDCKAMNEEQQ